MIDGKKQALYGTSAGYVVELVTDTLDVLILIGETIESRKVKFIICGIVFGSSSLQMPRNYFVCLLSSLYKTLPFLIISLCLTRRMDNI